MKISSVQTGVHCRSKGGVNVAIHLREMISRSHLAFTIIYKVKLIIFESPASSGTSSPGGRKMALVPQAPIANINLERKIII